MCVRAVTTASHITETEHNDQADHNDPNNDHSESRDAHLARIPVEDKTVA